MNKLFAIIAILLGLVTFQMAATYTSIFSNSSDPTILAGLDFPAVVEGHFLQFWSQPVLWQGILQWYPVNRLLWNTQTLLIVPPLLAALIYFFRFKREASWATVGWLCLLTALIPYVLARVFLWNNTSLGASGALMVAVLASQIYSALACIACASAEFLAPLRRLFDWTVPGE